VSVQEWSAKEGLHPSAGVPDYRWWAADVSSLRRSSRQLGHTHRRLAELLSAGPSGAEPEITQPTSWTEQRPVLSPSILQPRPGAGVSEGVWVSLPPPASTGPPRVARVVPLQTLEPAVAPSQETASRTGKGFELPMALVVTGIAMLLLAIVMHLA